MKLGTRIFLSYLILFGFGFYYLIDNVLDTLRVRYLEGVEQSLVDESHILATFIEKELKSSTLPVKQLHAIFQ
jgi:two-component system sensor histidine kinase CreC